MRKEIRVGLSKFKSLFILLIILTSVISFIPIPKAEALGENWLSGWNYRKQHNITGATGAGTNYQMNITGYYNASLGNYLTDWTKDDANNPVIDNSQKVWDAVWYEDGVYYAYLGWHTASDIHLYNSTDGYTFTEHPNSPVLTRGVGWDSSTLEPHSIQKIGETYYMYYCARGSGYWCIGLATSSSLTSGWTKYGADGKLFGATESWEKDGVADPKVALYNETYYMYYGAYESPAGWTGEWGSANSSDGITWTKCDYNPILINAGVEEAYAESEGMYLVVAHADGKQYSGWSNDGVIIKEYADVMLEKGGTDDFDENGLGHGSILKVGSTYWYYFGGLSGASYWTLGRASTTTETSIDDGGAIVDFDEKCRTDFGDVRFTSSDGSTLLDYWIEEKTDSSSATFWVEISADLGSDQTIYVYYGNDGAETTSDGDDTFFLFDDFDDNSFDTAKWDLAAGSMVEQNQRLEGTQTGAWDQVRSDDTFAYNLAMHVQARGTMDSSGWDTYFGYENAQLTGVQNIDTWKIVHLGGFITWDTAPPTFVDDRWYDFEIRMDGAECWWLINDIEYNYESDATANNAKIQLDTSIQGYYDNLYVRKFIDPQPSNGMWGSEETSGYPILEDITETTVVGDTTHTISYPETVNADDLLIAVFGCDDDETSVTFPNEGSEWYEIYFEDAGSSGPTLAVAWKEAVGTEDGGTFNILTPTAEGSACYVYRFSGMEDPDTQAPEVSSTASGSSVNPNSLTLSPTGGSKAYTWISVEANDDDDDTTGYPSNMGQNNQFAQVVTFTLGMAMETSTTATFDPAQFTIAAAETWEAVTIAVHPAGEPNNAPTNDQCSITDLDDTDDFYAQISGGYTVDFDIADGDGFADINYAEVRFKQGAATRAIFRYDEDTNTFSTESGDTEWELDIGSCSATESGNYINMTFKVSAEWDATEEADLEIECYVVDDEPESDTDTMQTDYFDVITNLLTSSIEFTDGDNPDRVNVGSSVTCDFSVRYAIEPGSGTASTFYPPDAEFTSIAVYDEADSTLGTDTSIVNGDGQITETAKSTVETENYNLYVDMVDADYTDAEETATEQLITDNIEIVSVAFDDSRVDISSAAEVRYVLRYNYDDVSFETGDGSIVGFTWDGVNSWWDKAITAPASPSADNYDENDLGTLTDSNYGLTVYEDDAGSNIIGDRINFLTATLETTDARINDDTNGEWYAELKYEYDNAEVDDGSVTLNTGSMSWSGGNSRWEYTYGLGSVGATSRNIASASGNEYGITELNSAVTSDSEIIIYDRIVAYWEEVTDTRQNIDENVEYRIKAVLDYDDEEIGSGDSITSSWGALSWDAVNSWWDLSHQESTVGAYTISLTAGSEADYGITLFSENITETSVIYDQIVAYWEQLDDSRVNINTNIEWRIKAVLDYDDTEIGSGDSITSSWGALTWDSGNSWFDIAHQESTVNAYQISLTAGTEATFSISAFSENITESDGIFDQIQLQSLGANNTSPLEDEMVEIYATAQSAYDGHVLGSGDSLTLEDTDANTYTMTYNGTHWLNVATEEDPVERTLNTYDSVSEVTFSITTLDVNSLSVVITWGESNNAPVNDLGSITNMDDTDNLNAQFKVYLIDYDGHDDDGYIDIDYVLVNLTQASTIRASFKYDNATNTFSQIDGTTGYEIITGSCSASRSGNNMNLTFAFKVKWGATEESDIELKAVIMDVEPVSDTDTLQTDYADAVTNLLISGFACDDDRGDFSTSLTFTGTVYYADNPASGTPSSRKPPDAEFTSIDIHKADHTEVGTDSTILDGAFSASVTAEATVDITTYHAFIDMVDADYTDIDESPTDTFISDQIVAYWEQLNDTRRDIDSPIEWRIKAVLDYDDEEIGSGDSITSSWGALSWDAVNSWWDLSHQESTVGAYTITLTAGSETGYTITGFTENITESSGIFDLQGVWLLDCNDTSPEVGDWVRIWTLVQSTHDDHNLTSGDDLILEDVVFTWNGPYWLADVKYDVPHTLTMDEGSCNETTYDITALDLPAIHILEIEWGLGNQPPDSPTFTYPANMTTQVPTSALTIYWTFSDTDEDGQLAYQIQFSMDTAFSDVDLDSGKTTSTDEYYNCITSGEIGLHYIRCKTWDDYDNEGPWSDTLYLELAHESTNPGYRMPRVEDEIELIEPEPKPKTDWRSLILILIAVLVIIIVIYLYRQEISGQIQFT